MEVAKIGTQQTLETSDVISYLESLVQSFKSGTIVVRQGDDFVNLTPPKIVEVEVEAKAKKDKFKFSLEMEWRSEPAAEPAELTITDEAPAAPEAEDDAGDSSPSGEPQ